MKGKFASILFWMVIAAAFIGPGTVTVTAASGAGYGYSLLWALLFSTFACLVLQESAARVSITSGKNLGELVLYRFKSKKLAWFLAIAVFLGCAAYEAGNILGSISGLALIVVGINPAIFTIIIVAIAVAVLWLGNIKTVANIMGMVVALMGFTFLIVGLSMPIDWGGLVQGMFVPSFPEGGILLTLGLVGTTIVPYNIFMGSGLAKGQDVKSMRFGLTIAVILGGLISMGIVLVGTSIVGEFNFVNLANSLESSHGKWMAIVFAIGLFAAGFTSSITAPLAAAITLKSVSSGNESWSETGNKYRMAWSFILLTGLVFGVTGVKPIPVIIMAQAANGLILPVLAIFLWIISNNSTIAKEYVNSHFVNFAMALTVFVASVLGLINVFKASYTALSSSFAFTGIVQIVILVLAFSIAMFTLLIIVKERTSETHNLIQD
jgi:manganese transport protein